MATLHHNIIGTTAVELLAAGDKVPVSKVSLTNASSSNAVSVDLYIQKVGLGKFHLLAGLSIPVGVTFVYDEMKFSNNDRDFGLYVKCTGTSPIVDVIIN